MSHQMTTFCKENNKLGTLNCLAWKKIIDLILIENEVFEYVKGAIDSNLNKNAINYRYNHKYKDAVEITLHFINIKH